MTTLQWSALVAMALSLSIGLWLIARELRRSPLKQRIVCARCGKAGSELSSFNCPGCQRDVRELGLISRLADQPLSLITRVSIYTLGILLLAAMTLSAIDPHKLRAKASHAEATLAPRERSEAKPFRSLHVQVFGQTQGDVSDGTAFADLSLLSGEWTTLTIDIGSHRVSFTDSTGRKHAERNYEHSSVADWFIASGLSPDAPEVRACLASACDLFDSILAMTEMRTFWKADDGLSTETGTGGLGGSGMPATWPWSGGVLVSSLIWLLMVILTVGASRETAAAANEAHVDEDHLRFARILHEASAAVSISSVCGRCAYSTRGLTELVCPECGGDFREVGIDVPMSGPEHPRSFVVLTFFIFSAAVGVAGYIASIALAHTLPVHKIYENRVGLASRANPVRSYRVVGAGSSFSDTVRPFPVTINLAVAKNPARRLMFDPVAADFHDPDDAAFPRSLASTATVLKWLRKAGLPQDPSTDREAEQLMGYVLSESRPFWPVYRADGTAVMSGTGARDDIFGTPTFSRRATGEISRWFSIGWIAPALLVWLVGVRYLWRHHNRVGRADRGFTPLRQKV